MPDPLGVALVRAYLVSTVAEPARSLLAAVGPADLYETWCACRDAGLVTAGADSRLVDAARRLRDGPG